MQQTSIVTQNQKPWSHILWNVNSTQILVAAFPIVATFPIVLTREKFTANFKNLPLGFNSQPSHSGIIVCESDPLLQSWRLTFSFSVATVVKGKELFANCKRACKAWNKIQDSVWVVLADWVSPAALIPPLPCVIV